MPLAGRKAGEGVRVMALVYELLLPSLISIYAHIRMHEHVRTHVHTHTHACHVLNAEARAATCQLCVLCTVAE